jgi:hypothetical protein
VPAPHTSSTQNASQGSGARRNVKHGKKSTARGKKRTRQLDEDGPGVGPNGRGRNAQLGLGLGGILPPCTTNRGSKRHKPQNATSKQIDREDLGLVGEKGEDREWYDTGKPREERKDDVGWVGDMITKIALSDCANLHEEGCKLWISALRTSILGVNALDLAMDYTTNNIHNLTRLCLHDDGTDLSTAFDTNSLRNLTKRCVAGDIASIVTTFMNVIHLMHLACKVNR